MKKNNRYQKGITLLEYTAGAAVIIGIVWLAMSAMGNNIADVFTSIGNWADSRSNQIDGGNGGGNNGN
jgi:hypothetical protein